MRMDVDQAGHDELAARVERCGRLGGERGLDGGDSAGRDADVAHGVEPKRRVDDAPAFDDEVVAARLCAEPACSPRAAPRSRRRTRTRVYSWPFPPAAAYAPSLASPRARVTVCQSEKHAAVRLEPGRLTWRHPSWTNGGDDDEKLGGGAGSGGVCRFGLRARSGAAEHLLRWRQDHGQRARARRRLHARPRHPRERRAARGDVRRSRGA